MLRRKYYRMLARVIKDNSVELVDETIQDSEGKWYINKDNLIHDLSRELKQDNINFNYTRFDEACND